MPRLSFPKVTRPIDPAEYLPELEGQPVIVWVNPPLDDLRQLIDALQNNRDADAFTGLAALWDWTPEEVKEQFDECKRVDPDFWSWLIERTFTAINEYRDERKKALKARSG